MTDIIYTSDKYPIRPVDSNYKHFLNKAIVIYGETNTGKSRFVKWLCGILKPHIAAGALICPTVNTLSNKFYASMFPRKAIIKYAQVKWFKDLYARQEWATDLYEKVNDMATLGAMFQRVADQNGRDKLDSIRNETDRAIASFDQIPDSSQREIKIEQARGMRDTATRNLYKRYISDNRFELEQMQLTPPEKIALLYHDFNPTYLLVMDDCGANAEEWKKDITMNKFFMQGRHINITMIVALQNDKNIPPPLRQNASVSIFTTQASVSGFLETSTNNIPKELKRIGKLAAEAVFKSNVNEFMFRRLIYIRSDSHPFKWGIALDPGPIEMFGDSVRSFLNYGKRQNESQNPFIKVATKVDTRLPWE